MLGISTHAPLAGRDEFRGDDRKTDTISTHAPLAGRDKLHSCEHTTHSTISTHAPLAGRDKMT